MPTPEAPSIWRKLFARPSAGRGSPPLRTAEEELRVLDSFLSVAVHELKNPFTALRLKMGLASEIARGRRDCPLEEAHRLILSCHSQVERIARLIEALFDFSSIKQGQFQIQPERSDAHAVLREAVETCGLEGAEIARRIEIEAPVGETELWGAWDRCRLTQVMRNLIVNALKYGEGKPVRVSIAADADGVTIHVRDQGPGIPAGSRDEIFDRFTRLSPRAPVTGLGLGLFIARRIVEAHGGKIHVEAPNGPGALFVVRLPRFAENRPSPASPSP